MIVATFDGRESEEAALKIELTIRGGRYTKAKNRLLKRLGNRLLALLVLQMEKENGNWMRDVVQRYGWPNRDVVGGRAASYAWLLVLHADHDRALQRRSLDLLTTSTVADPGSQIAIAFLDDRLRVAEGRPQLYGTQLQRVGDEFIP